jgi:hypothetical protein
MSLRRSSRIAALRKNGNYQETEDVISEDDVINEDVISEDDVINEDYVDYNMYTSEDMNTEYPVPIVPECGVCLSEGLSTREHLEVDHKCELCGDKKHNVTMYTDIQGKTIAQCINRPAVVCNTCQSAEFKCTHNTNNLVSDCFYCTKKRSIRCEHCMFMDYNKNKNKEFNTERVFFFAVMIFFILTIVLVIHRYMSLVTTLESCDTIPCLNITQIIK